MLMCRIIYGQFQSVLLYVHKDGEWATDHRYTDYDISCDLLIGFMRCYVFLLLRLSFYQVKLSMFYNVQTTNFTFVGKI